MERRLRNELLNVSKSRGGLTKVTSKEQPGDTKESRGPRSGFLSSVK